ncbi:hypothetical protein AAE478_010385 [Parahypoxylon ruwenzoriense]
MAGWSDLAVDLKLMVFNYLVNSERCLRPKDEDDRPHRYKSTYATVSREWRAFFESKNFMHLVLHQSDLADFERVFTRARIQVPRPVWLRVQLPSYNCHECSSEESQEEATVNNIIFTSSLWKFTILGVWKDIRGEITPQKEMTMILSVYSPSDREHHFRDHPFDDDKETCYYRSARIDYDDPSHGWHSSSYVAPGLGPKLRLLGNPLDLNFRQISADSAISLPTLDFISELQIPRQFYRATPRLDLILKSLPKLQTLRYEPWRHVTDDCERHRELNFHEILQAFPKTLTKFSAFMDSNDALRSQPEKVINTMSIASVREASFRFTELAASFIVDAEWFFYPFHPAFYMLSLNM